MRLRNFLRDERGNFAMLTVLALLPILGTLAVGIDYIEMSRQKAELQNAIDAAAIAGTRFLMDGGSEDDLEAYTVAYVRTNLDPALALKTNIAVTPPDPDNGRPELGVAATLEYDAYFYGPFLKLQSPGTPEDDITMHASTEVMPPNGGVLAALVLDNTGSMWSSNNIGALRDASVLLLDELFGEDTYPDDVRAAIVPYSSAVNPGSVAPGLIDSASEYTEVVDMEDEDADPLGWRGCVMERAGADSIDDTPPSTAKWQPFLYPSALDNAYDPSDASTVIPGGLYDSNGITGPNIGCPTPITALTNDRDGLKSDAQAMSAWNRGGTLTDIGVAWGLRVLSPGEPFTESTEIDPQSAKTLWEDPRWHKFMVIMTDGESQLYNLPGNAGPNKADPSKSDYSGYGRLGESLANNILGTSDSNQAKLAVNNRVATLCARAKADDIFIYAIVFTSRVSDATKDIYRQCASRTNAYFYAPDQTSLKAAFKSIGGEMSKLRISR